MTIKSSQDMLQSNEKTCRIEGTIVCNGKLLLETYPKVGMALEKLNASIVVATWRGQYHLKEDSFVMGNFNFFRKIDKAWVTSMSKVCLILYCLNFF